MADDTNLSNSPANPPINNEPTQSPLEQSGPSSPDPQNIAGADTTPVSNAPLTPDPQSPVATPTSPTATEPLSEISPAADFAPAPAAVPEQPSEMPAVSPTAQPVESPAPSESSTLDTPAPPTTSVPDYGESAPAPDTDEFLKSILQEQPQRPAENVGDADMPSNSPASEMSPDVPVSQPIQEVPSVTTPPSTPDLNDKSIDQLQSPSPAQTSELSDTQTTSEPKISDSVTVPPMRAPMPEGNPPQPPQAPADNGIGGASPSGSPVKLIIIAVLALLVIGGAYYAYTAFFAAPTPTTSTGLKKSATKTATIAATQDAQRKADLIILQEALINYSASSGGKYPVSASYAFLNQPDNILEKELLPTYLSKLPQDPSSSKSYAYKSDGITFSLTAELDNANDPEVINTSGKNIYELNSSTSGSTSTFPASDNTLVTATATTTN